MFKYLLLVSVCIPCVILAPAKSAVLILKSELDESTLASALATDLTTSAPVVKEEVSSPESITSAPTQASTQASTEEPATTTRRLISYDQRQEGKYNVRADLDNFVILVVPQNPSSAFNILDLLTKSTSGKKKAHAKHSNKKHSISSHHQSHHQHPEPHSYDVSKPMTDQFIEGRTPYRVDISSIDSSVVPEMHIASSRLTFPGSSTGASGKNLIRFEVEPESDPSVPYASVYPVKGNINNNYKKNYGFSRKFGGGASRTHSIPIFIDQDNSYIRSEKSLPHDYDYVNPMNYNKNRLLTHARFHNENRNSDIHDIFDSLNIASLDTNKFGVNQEHNGWDLKLIGATEQCGPDMQRDSYGVCQFINYT